MANLRSSRLLAQVASLAAVADLIAVKGCAWAHAASIAVLLNENAPFLGGIDDAALPYELRKRYEDLLQVHLQSREAIRFRRVSRTLGEGSAILNVEFVE
jgi:hypothetical protein